MTEETAAKRVPPQKASRLPLVLGLVLAIIGGGGGFYAVKSGLFPGSNPDAGGEEPARHGAMGIPDATSDITYVAIEPLLISLPEKQSHLRFRAQLEVPTTRASEVEKLMPRVVDVLNTYLRALKTEDLTDGASLARLRAQMLRRIQIVMGNGRVNDLLIMEFVVN